MKSEGGKYFLAQRIDELVGSASSRVEHEQRFVYSCFIVIEYGQQNNQSSSVRSRQGNSNSRDKMFCKGLCETLNLTSTFSPLGW